MWDTVGSFLATKLQKLNNRAGRVISELGYEIRSSEIRNHLGWSTLQERRTKHISTLMYKILHNEAPNNRKQLFHYVNESSNYELRDSNINFILPNRNSDYLKKSFSFTESKAWNNLPLNTKISTSLSLFKRKLSHPSSLNNFIYYSLYIFYTKTFFVNNIRL